VDRDACQLHSMDDMKLPALPTDGIGYVAHRLRRMVKRRREFVYNSVRRVGEAEDSAQAARTDLSVLQPGDRIRVRSKDEIRSTLNNWNELERCGFMEEMWEFCDTEQAVLKQVVRFLDERDYKVKRVQHIYLLKDLLCGGTVDFGPCDRSCFFFWRREWLEKL
jgi:hypothetical protein